jgi:hypothetical protein
LTGGTYFPPDCPATLRVLLPGAAMPGGAANSPVAARAEPVVAMLRKSRLDVMPGTFRQMYFQRVVAWQAALASLLRRAGFMFQMNHFKRNLQAGCGNTAGSAAA